MGHLKILIAFFCLGAFCSSPVFSQDLIATDEDLDASFENYNTFGWTSEAKRADAKDFLNDVALKSTIRDAIRNELDARGYNMEGNDPDLMVNFKIFEEPTEFQGYTGYREVGNERVKEDEDFKIYKLQGGTLLIQLLDKGKGSIVWQGYASGLIDDQDMFDKNPERIKDAVQQIFNRFDYKANE